MPGDDMKHDMPRRRRGANAVAIESDTERGLVGRILTHSPKDMAAGLLAFAAVSAIIANALWLQAAPHPSPMVGGGTSIPAADGNPFPARPPLEAQGALL